MVFASHLVLNAFQSLLWKEQGIAEDMIGILIALGALSETVMFFAFKRFAGRFTARNLLLISAIVSAARWLAMSFSPDGKWLATAGVDRTVYLWDTKTWKLARKLTGHGEMISALAFSADGKRIVTGGFREITQTAPVKIVLWDSASGKMLRTFDAPRRVSSTVFSPDGKWIAAAFRDKTVQIFAAE